MQLSRPFATITPTLDGDVLAVLASTDAAFTVPQMLRIVSRGSDEGLRNALSRLVGTGVVHQEKVGRTSTYRLNRAHLAAEPIVALARLNDTLHERLRAMTAGWAETPRFAAIFGSAATGRMREDSDVDLFLVRSDVSADEAWDSQMTDLVTAVSGWTGNDARPIDYTESELRDAAASREPLLQDVVRDGLTFAGSGGGSCHWYGGELVGGKRSCNAVVIAGRLAKAVELNEAAENTRTPRTTARRSRSSPRRMPEQRNT